MSNHSRDSSNASDNYSPVTPTFSSREHSRMASSNTSLSSTPSSFEHIDSPLAGKSILGDLVEEPGEREDGLEMGIPSDMRKISLCSSCKSSSSRSSRSGTDVLEGQPDSPENFAVGRPSLDYDLTDRFYSETDLSLRVSRKRRGSGDSASPVAHLASRVANRFPSFSRRLTERRQSIVINTQGIRSAPISRAPSFRLPSLTKSLVSHLESHDLVSPPQTPAESVCEDLLSLPTSPLDLSHGRVEDPIDRKALASTPLLPPLITKRRDSDPESIKSPLQSPTVADPFTTTPSSEDTPTLYPMPTPPLSSRPSATSFSLDRSVQTHSATDIPSMAPEITKDKWTAKLGHANFGIFPEPYLPTICSSRACMRLTDDWECARRQYLNHAAHISEHYGPTSQTFKFTEMKWAEIDAKWKRNHESAIALATANGECPVDQPLAESAPLVKMPSIHGPEAMGKFPSVENAEIVGPMVQYAKIRPRQSKRSTIMRFFSDIGISGRQ